MSIQSIGAGKEKDFYFGIKGKNIIGSWKSGYYKITLFISEIQDNRIKAFVENVPLGTFAFYEPHHVKCGILGFIPHRVCIKKINHYNRETIEKVFRTVLYSPNSQVHEVWFFEAESTITSSTETKWFKKCFETEEKSHFYLLLTHLEKVVAVQQQIGNNPVNLAAVVLQLQQELQKRLENADESSMDMAF